MLTVQEARTRVQAGIAWLDQNTHFDWRARITQPVDLFSNTRCVIAQAFQTTFGMAAASMPTVKRPELGFWFPCPGIGQCHSENTCSCVADYKLLMREWQLALGEPKPAQPTVKVAYSPTFGYSAFTFTPTMLSPATLPQLVTA